MTLAEGNLVCLVSKFVAKRSVVDTNCNLLFQCFSSALTSKCMDISVFSVGSSIQSMDSYHSFWHEFPSPCLQAVRLTVNQVYIPLKKSVSPFQSTVIKKDTRVGVIINAVWSSLPKQVMLSFYLIVVACVRQTSWWEAGHKSQALFLNSEIFLAVSIPYHLVF